MIPKFRAYDSGSLSRMYQPDEVMVGDGNIWIIDEDSVAGEWIVNNDINLMQSTGFEDNLGDVVFEGDIILWTYWDGFEDSGRAKIVFDKGMFKLLDICTEKEVWDNLFDCNENCDIYIQGNIYENPELLEVEE
nr:MAG TPA: YopX protein [Caudoviricetes sp.]